MCSDIDLKFVTHLDFQLSQPQEKFIISSETRKQQNKYCS